MAQTGFEPVRPNRPGDFLTTTAFTVRFLVVVWTISSSVLDVTYIVSEPSPFYRGSAAD